MNDKSKTTVITEEEPIGEYTVNREYKSRLFSFLFGSEDTKDRTLSLYNSLNGTNYTDPNDITITTIGDVIYMGMKNDLSFIVLDRASLYSTMNINEHQSSDNPNIPLRELMYAARIYDKYLKRNKKNPYSSRIIPLPIPKLVVLYNGRTDVPDESVIKLSDAFKAEIRKTILSKPGYADNFSKNEIDREVMDVFEKADPDIEVKVRMININYGHSKEILSTCKPLYEYAWLVDRIRKNTAAGMELEPATDYALHDMPDEFLIKDQLMEHKAEVVGMWISEYNEGETMQMFKEEGREEGRNSVIIDMLKRGKTPEAISEFCGYPLELIKNIEREMS